MRIRVLAVIITLMCLSGMAQNISYFNQGFLRQPSAALDRAYLGIYGTNDFVAGAGIVFTPVGVGTISISAPGGGGSLQLFGDVTSPLTALPNVTATLANVGIAGTYTKTTFNGKGLETSGGAAILASADFANQGTVSTVLHGNLFGNPSWTTVDLGSEVAGLLPTASWQGSTNVWNLTGNTLSNTNQFLGSVNNLPLFLKYNSIQAATFDTNGSVAIGAGASAPGVQSVAIATNSLSTGVQSISIGNLAKATNNTAVAIGVTAAAGGSASVAIGQGSKTTGQGSTAMSGGIANGAFSLAVGISSTAGGNSGVALGNSALEVNSGSFVWFDTSGDGVPDTGDNQFVVTAEGGIYFWGNGNGSFNYDGDMYSYTLNSINNLSVGNDANIKNITRSTNGVYVGCKTNVMGGTAGYPTTTTNVPIVITPVGLFGYLGFVGTNTVTISTAGVYVNVASNGLTFNRVLTNGFGANVAKGMLTNLIAGYYGVRISMSAEGGGAPSVNGKEYEIQLFVNGLDEDFLSDIATGSAANNVWGPTHAGIIYLAQNSILECRVKQVTPGVVASPSFIRLYVSIGTP